MYIMSSMSNSNSNTVSQHPLLVSRKELVEQAQNYQQEASEKIREYNKSNPAVLRSLIEQYVIFQSSVASLKKGLLSANNDQQTDSTKLDPTIQSHHVAVELHTLINDFRQFLSSRGFI